MCIRDRAEKKRFEIVVSTHCDRDHIHSHFVMNSVNTETGKKFHINENEIELMMKESDRIIQQYGLSVLPPQPKKQKVKPMSDREYRSADNGQSWKLRLAMVIDDAMLQAISREHFIELMELEGYSVKWTDERKYITYTTPDGFKCRDNKLHEEKYLKGNMENEFRIRKEITAGIKRASQTADTNSGESRAVRGGYRAELESDDWLTENANGYADREILEGQAQLTTRSDLTRVLQQQNETLMKFTEETETVTVEFQKQMAENAQEFTEQMNTEMHNMSSQAGKMSELFLKTLSMAEDRMKKCLRKAFWISLIPTAILIIWELIRHFWLQS